MRIVLLSLALIATPISAAERGYSVTDFDRIRVDAPVRVTLLTGLSPSARATGGASALDALRVEVQGRTLVIARNTSAWGGGGANSGPVEVKVSGHLLRAAAVNGAGLLSVDAVRGQAVQLSLAGPGALEVGKLDADTLSATLVGDGRMTLGGKARTATLQLRGGGGIAADALITDHLRVGADGTGSLKAQARVVANVQAAGTGMVTVTGTPACTVKASGSALVACGSDQGQR